MRILVIQHSAADSAAAAAPILDILGHEVATIRIDRGDNIPTAVEYDALLLFGGPHGLTNGEIPAWIAEEQALIQNYVDKDRKVMGICLGAQIVASALGAKVRRNEQPEVGWHRVVRVANDSQTSVDAFPEEMTVFQWHQDTFGIPTGATRLFESEACIHQAFGIDERVFGFQFHLEANERTVRMFQAISALSKKKGEYIQREEEVLAGITSHLPRQTDRLRSFLTRFLPRS